MTLYQWSDIEVQTIDLSKSRINKDFGRGFYLSSDLDQARNFARYKADKPWSQSKTPVVTAFEFDDNCLSDGSLRINRFEGYCME